VVPAGFLEKSTQFPLDRKMSASLSVVGKIKILPLPGEILVIQPIARY